jgi:transcriptional regulator of arginine metabolism
LLADRAVESQHELVDLLGAEGHQVTQATVSRDLDALGAVKQRDNAGRARYVIPAAAADGRLAPALARALGEFVESIDAAGNLVVVRTSPGAAHLVAGTIDGADLDGVLGTVAGDDTLIVVAREDVGGHALGEILERTGAAR